MPIKHWPIEDRPTEKLINKGAKHLTDAELLAILLKTGIKGKSALDIAKELLIQYGDLRRMLATPISALIQTKGLGKAKLAPLFAAVELGKRCSTSKLVAGDNLNSSSKTTAFLCNKLQSHLSEVFACLFLDSHFRLIQFEELFFGTIHSASVYPREIIRRGIAHNAAKVILAHNHPSGNPSPSQADKDITLLIKQTLANVDIEVIDHVIIGQPHHFSFAEQGLI